MDSKERIIIIMIMIIIIIIMRHSMAAEGLIIICAEMMKVAQT